MSAGDASLIRTVLFFGGLLLLGGLEFLIAYRSSTVPRLKRWAINLGLTAINSLVLAVVFRGATLAAAEYTASRQLGILNLVQAPYWLKVLAALVIMDFLLYIWHLLNHEVPLLWRFHRVHHTDKNMDVSTATRFHLGELSLSAIIKTALIFFLGADVLMVIVFESSLVLCAQFHHSSIRVAAWFEKLLWPLFVPPSMHRIHHSVKIKERDANYGTIFSLWDRIMGTLRKDVDQKGIIIGIGGHFDQKKLGLGHLMIMPFTRYVP